MKFHKKLKHTIILLLLVVVIGFYLLPNNEEPQNIIFPVTLGKIEKRILATGKVQALTKIDVGAQVSGQIKQILVKEGQKVKKGDLLAIIDPQLAETELKLALAELENLRGNLAIKSEQLKQRQMDVERQYTLMQKNATSKQLFETSKHHLSITKAEVRIAQSNLASAQIKVEKSQTQLRYTEIRSPMDTTVVSVTAKSGQTLVTTQQAPILMQLADIETMQIETNISEADVISIKIGAPVSFTLLGKPDNKHYSKLDNIKLIPTANDQKAVYYYATFKVPNPEHKLRIAMTASVSILLDKKENVLTIPLSLLGKMIQPNQYYVTVLQENGNQEQRLITTGLQDNSQVEVVKGLSLKERVVLSTDILSSNNNENEYKIL
ncbi:efflux RND transporter periplasmic adaptor subunit [Pasteurella atlantica]|uniref:efflux RND transporter periplasmic adaptor subunit n=1 Tax=Pasteurellaceae TaxID=712 RepID=UPI00276CBDEF|nr:efflux RND transporter periplasmic adaptor subunit [Pasteurella atlantica]MDP8032981.1 efflux RND transporter periplasmic adaptor subunit [Pasteurella atlantica]MDP8034862.1 efflux RND transporter periplasmic adaptor subunit [Pasteurella atlantica]MDP8036868.1 efflux RND transporter periplasmic adaptor subunit [Pasteurella atlantica]MDP8047159.1 efflux RND transporter periplasmic adaptor subunit [Pasteurella atlantica]MDP8049331.1 efflux RND transporter periplasmic adaptor subunit [Pasteure